MKEFNLDAALNGEPVKLRNGNKAFICYKLSRDFKYWDGSPINFNICGYILNFNGDIAMLNTAWKEDGKWTMDETKSDRDIIGMWEEPKLTSEQVLEKAYNEDSLVLCDGNPDLPLKIIAKTKDGEFVMQPEDNTIQPWLANLTMEWFFAKDLDPKFDTITNAISLPKPFKPKDGESYYYICGRNIECMRNYAEVSHSDSTSAQNGQCFRTKQDAQKWLDFMKSMVE